MMTRKFTAWATILVLVLLAMSCTQSCTRIQTMLENSTGQQGDPATADDSDQSADVILEDQQNFQAFLAEVQNMRRSRIANMNSGDLMEFAAPLTALKQDSRVFSSQTLSNLERNHQKSGRDIRNMNRGEYEAWGGNVQEIVMEGRENETTWNADSDIMREILLNLNENVASESVCSSLFNRAGRSVYLTQGDDVNAANSVCPGGTGFVLLPGVYSLAAVESSKANNSWAGIGNVDFEGKMNTERAFDGGLSGNTVRGIHISKYTEFGIYATGLENLVIKDMMFSEIAVDKNGQSHGAVMFFDAENIEISASEFSDVASSVRIVSSRGPIQVTDNSAVNSGRNFFQCDKCIGGGIRINRNSMDHKKQTGTQPLEDWINIYQSNGLANDPIQVNNNRARGHSESKSGSFIMLGDSGGAHQVARGNIGVNPGQVGIGIAGGNHIRLENNTMYSESWEGSNVAYYSALYSEECGNHTFALSGNIAHWINSSGQLNRSWTDEQCGVSMSQVRSRVTEDRTVGAEIWDEWQP